MLHQMEVNMYKYLYFIIFPVVIYFIFFFLNKLRQKTTNELEKVLFIQNNPTLYLQLLENPNLKLLYGKSTRLQFKLNAYLLTGDDSNITDTIALMDAIVMSKGQDLEYQQKKLSYYCSSGKKDEAEAALQKIERILAKGKGEHAQFILKESRMIFNIYVMHDTELIPELEEASRKEQGFTRGLTLYRLAKLNFFKQNDKKAQSYLLQAKELLANTVWSDVVESALQDKAILNYK